MPPAKKKRPKVKSELHPRNQHRERYDFQVLTATYPPLAPYVRPNKFNDDSIDFADPEAVKVLNAALLKHYYAVENWDIPPGYLCPPIPGRADYIHHVADLLGAGNQGEIPTGPGVRCIDIGVGANCVYPIIGNKVYGWSFVGSDIDPVSIASANKIIEANPRLKDAVECRLQPNPEDIFVGIIQAGEMFDLTICNPPFHTSMQAAQTGTLRKLRNLNQEKVLTPTLNFGGQNKELWCRGGEEKFVLDIIRQSLLFAKSCRWFSSLVSNQAHLKSIYKALEKAGAVQVVTIPMGQGNKISRAVAWTFLARV
ncbi:MAG: 23S rRNA (adenine(1618)-N(6))-methyltransferase RlmF [Lewinellaceae bacterium]|nr:23S rRNA (adenine(1618)-N(6))-methyltransferase RlmF [Lewinellaceae bacterium]